MTCRTKDCSQPMSPRTSTSNRKPATALPGAARESTGIPSAPQAFASKPVLSFSHQRTASYCTPGVPSAGRAALPATKALTTSSSPLLLAQKAGLGGRSHCKRRQETTAKWPPSPRTPRAPRPLDTSVKLGAAQQRALKDLVAMGFGKQACKEALLRTGTTSMDRLLAALTGPEEPPSKEARRGGHAESGAKT